MKCITFCQTLFLSSHLLDGAVSFTTPPLVAKRTIDSNRGLKTAIGSSEDKPAVPVVVEGVSEASSILAEWDKLYNPENMETSGKDADKLRPKLRDAVERLSTVATDERTKDSTTGRCMLGICAPSPEEGIATLKSWVTNLQLPRGMLHGMDKDGVPIEMSGGVYIKYNSGGVYSFADIRKSGLGFDALWKPGDALLEPYDGTYRGVYFQVELLDGEFRQFLVPLNLFDESFQ